MRDDDGRGRQVEKFDNTHRMRQQVPELPWHTPDKPFGISQAEWDSHTKPDHLQYCFCGRRGVYLLTRWYCQECWNEGDDEDWEYEQPDYGGHA